MKVTFYVAVVLSCLASFACAVPPAKADDAKKKKEPKPEKVDERKLMTKYDTDNDRKLDKTELSAALKSLKHNEVTTKNDAWKKFDEDGDGKIDHKELGKLLDSNAEPAEGKTAK